MAVTCPWFGIFTFIFILFQQVYSQRWWTTPSTTTKYDGSCSYREVNYYYGDYMTKYKYCYYKCCGTYTNRHCCYKSYSYEHYQYKTGTNIGAVVGVLLACGFIFLIFICVCHVIRKSNANNQQDRRINAGRPSLSPSGNVNSSQTSDANAYLPPSYIDGISNTAYSPGPATITEGTPSAPPPSYDEVISQYTVHYTKEGENIYI